MRSILIFTFIVSIVCFRRGTVILEPHAQSPDTSVTSPNIPAADICILTQNYCPTPTYVNNIARSEKVTLIILFCLCSRPSY